MVDSYVFFDAPTLGRMGFIKYQYEGSFAWSKKSGFKYILDITLKGRKL